MKTAIIGVERYRVGSLWRRRILVNGREVNTCKDNCAATLRAIDATTRTLDAAGVPWNHEQPEDIVR